MTNRSKSSDARVSTKKKGKKGLSQTLARTLFHHRSKQNNFLKWTISLAKKNEPTNRTAQASAELSRKESRRGDCDGKRAPYWKQTSVPVKISNGDTRNRRITVKRFDTGAITQGNGGCNGVSLRRRKEIACSQHHVKSKDIPGATCTQA